jgi:ornithine cyclodeaminase/alanine dehydrogenase-like protein (mu-crystallin family)
MLLITDLEVRQVLKMSDCIVAMERAFAEEARGIAVNKPRTRYKVPPDLDKAWLHGEHHSRGGAEFRRRRPAL